MRINAMFGLIVAAAAAIWQPAAANAAAYLEDFEGDFPAWESGWFGQNSNAVNVMTLLGTPNTDRGNNPDGLWLSDGDFLIDANIHITFDQTFGASLTVFSLDIAAHLPDAEIYFYDIDGNELLAEVISQTNGALLQDPGVYAFHTVTSSNGIGGFSIMGTGPEGRLSIDNVYASTQPVAEPATLAILGVGLLGLAGSRTRRAAA